MTVTKDLAADAALPRWVPDAARNYLHHTEGGLSIRAVARAKDCHPSTVMRQIRRFEGRRDDPLVDAALEGLSAQVSECDEARNAADAMTEKGKPEVAPLSQARIEAEARRILRRLCETGAVLAAGRGMETAVVVRATPDDGQVRTAVLGVDIAQALALKNWITCVDPDGRIVRYVITNAGRAALRELTAADENRAMHHAEAGAEPAEDWQMADLAGLSRQPVRYQSHESPLATLSRRKGRDGQPFLTRKQTTAGERLREDYELARPVDGTDGGWQAMMRGEVPDASEGAAQGVIDARARLRSALAELGPGLGDVALRCCCMLEGLEQTEKAMGWSARSGKIVLRIALERLARHYEQTQGAMGPMIG